MLFVLVYKLRAQTTLICRHMITKVDIGLLPRFHNSSIPKLLYYIVSDLFAPSLFLCFSHYHAIKSFIHNCELYRGAQFYFYSLHFMIVPNLVRHNGPPPLRLLRLLPLGPLSRAAFETLCHSHCNFTNDLIDKFVM